MKNPTRFVIVARNTSIKMCFESSDLKTVKLLIVLIVRFELFCHWFCNIPVNIIPVKAHSFLKNLSIIYSSLVHMVPFTLFSKLSWIYCQKHKWNICSFPHNQGKWIAGQQKRTKTQSNLSIIQSTGCMCVCESEIFFFVCLRVSIKCSTVVKGGKISVKIQ